MYLTQSIIADDSYMRLRVSSAAAQEGVTEVGIDPDLWAFEWRRVWAAAPGWAEAWESAQAGGVVDPGASASVITDSMILSQVQAMKPFLLVADYRPVVP